MAIPIDVPDTMGETSSQGRRRMNRLAAQAGSLSSLSTAAVHPTTGNLIFPAPSPQTGHIVSSLYPDSTPRLLPTPSGLSPPREISISPTGEWITLFHPQPIGEGGTLAIYPQTILSPFTTPTTAIPLSTMVLPTSPLDIIHLYPPRLHLPNDTLSAPRGPLSPAGYDSTKGPAMVVLLPDALLFVYPQRIPGRTDGNDHQMNVLRAPLHTRAYVRVGESVSIGTAVKKAQKGWLGMVEGDEGVWIGLERGGEMGVVRVDIGVEGHSRWYVQTTPMPAVPRMERDGGVERAQVRKVVFLRRTKSSQSEEKEDITGESVQMVVVSQEHLSSQEVRIRMDSVDFERRGVILTDGFREIGGHSESSTPWDWHIIPNAAHATSPTEHTLLDLVPLTSFPPHNIALALLTTPRGAILASVSLSATEDAPSEGTPWKAILREEASIGEIGTPLRIAISPEVEQDGIGLACLVGEDGSTLIVRPSFSEPALSSEEPDIEMVAKQAARSIVLAIKQGRDWSGAVQAAFGLVKKSQYEQVAEVMIKEAHRLTLLDKAIDSIQEVFRVQVAVYGLYDIIRRDLAAEMLRLTEVSRILTASATVKEGIIIFDLDTIWDLIPALEWVSISLARAMRDTINERAKLDWGSLEQPPPLRLLYFVNPMIRDIVIQLLAQITAFIAFVLDVKRPILPPRTLLNGGQVQNRDNDATMQAKDRVRGMAARQGIDIAKWGKALIALHSNSALQEDTKVDGFLQLRLSISTEALGKILQSLPDPSSLFMVERNDTQLYDRMTFKPLPKALGSRCDRCKGYTVCWNGFAQPAGPSVWEQWKELQRMTCGCGGAWVR